MKKVSYSLYLVTEEATPMTELLSIVEEAVHGGVTMVQLREKQSDGKLFYEKALSLKRLLEKYSIPLIINDRIDIALAVGADGVHVGQSDLPIEAVRRIVPESMIVGISAKTIEEALHAEHNGADYLGVGSYFPTSSKLDADVIPKGTISTIKKAVHIPIVAIGGVNKETIPIFKPEQPDGYAVVSAIMKAAQPKQAAMHLKQLIEA